MCTEIGIENWGGEGCFTRSVGRSVGFKGSAISASGAQFRRSNRQLAFLETFQRLFSFWGIKKRGNGRRERRCKVDIPGFGNDST